MEKSAGLHKWLEKARDTFQDMKKSKLAYLHLQSSPDHGIGPLAPDRRI